MCRAIQGLQSNGPLHVARPGFCLILSKAHNISLAFSRLATRPSLSPLVPGSLPPYLPISDPLPLPPLPPPFSPPGNASFPGSLSSSLSSLPSQSIADYRSCHLLLRRRCESAQKLTSKALQGNTIGVGIINELKFPEDKKKADGAAKE